MTHFMLDCQQVTVVGFLISGELYINFQDISLYQVKVQELLAACGSAMKGDGTTRPLHPQQAVVTEATDLFISYCWNNSMLAHRNDSVQRFVGGYRVAR